jgi:hypothetical protein
LFARASFALVVLAGGVLATGCGTIRFASDTVVDADGRIVRTTRFSAAGTAFYEELLERYDLPPGGTWTEIEPESPGAADESALPERVYTLARHFAPGEPITGDYLRRNRGGAAAARNRIALRVRHYWIADTYRYEETFSDIVTAEGFEAALRRIYVAVIHALADEIARLPGAGVTIEESTARIEARADPLFEQFVRVLHEKCFRGEATLERCEEAIEAEPGRDYLVGLGGDETKTLDALREIFPGPPDAGADAWRETLRGTLERLAERADMASETLIDPVEEDLFGAHGFALFVSYPFELSVRLPGEHVASNADARMDGVLEWSFESEEFVLQPYTLEARSRIVHLERVLFLVLLAIVLVAMVGRGSDAKGRA